MKASLIVVLCIASYALGATILQRPVHPVFAGKEWNPTRIVGGSEAVPHSFPYQVALFLGVYFCGGSLISENWVLTAAHCGALTDTPQVLLGAHFIGNRDGVIINGKEPINHPDWDPNTLKNDISVIELFQAAILNSNVQPVTLAPANAGNYAGSTGTASGWGKDSDSATGISPILRFYSNPIIRNSVCKLYYGSAIQEGIVCVSGFHAKGACNGDSGGPLTVDNIQVGVTSFGSSLGCAISMPSAYTRVSSYKSWIKEITGV